MIVNSKRKNRIEKFFDKSHDSVVYEHNSLLDSNLSMDKIKERLKALIKEVPLYFDTYLSLAEIYNLEGNLSSAKNLIRKGYQLAIRRIVNQKGEFPKQMEWSWINNRHIIRIIDHWAYLLWCDGKEKKALKIFRNLFKSNPSDNIGARFDILAIRLGLEPDYELEFMSLLGGYIDAIELTEWFEINAKSFPEEFDWWFEIYE